MLQPPQPLPPASTGYSLHAGCGGKAMPHLIALGISLGWGFPCLNLGLGSWPPPVRAGLVRTEFFSPSPALTSLLAHPHPFPTV